MRYLTTAILSVLALALVQCNDGSSNIPPKTGSAGSSGTGNETGTAGTSGSGVAGTTGTAGTGDTSGTAGTGGSTSGAAGTATGEGGSGDTGGTTGAAGTTGDGGTTGAGGTSGGAAGTTGVGGSGGSAGSVATGRGGTSVAGTTGTGGTAGSGAGGTTGARTGPFKILMLTTTLEFKHDSIPTCLTMLQALGQANAPERAKIAGLPADTTWTVDQIASNPSAANYFSEITADNLKKYELFYSNNPTGPVFTNAPSGAQKKQIFVDYWNNGGAWAGQHSATDFEKASGGTSWTWFHDNIDGSYFVDHDPDRTPGTINWQPSEINHPILKGLPTPWSTSDEWYVMNRNVEAVPGIKVLAKVTVTNSSKGTTPRPAVWVTENANGKGGRSFYTIKGHNQSVYSEAQFRELMLRGILWSVHRLPGGN